MSSTARQIHLSSLSPTAVEDEIKQIKNSLGLRGKKWTFILRQNAHKTTWQLLGYLRELQATKTHHRQPHITPHTERERATMATIEINALPDLDGYGDEQFLSIRTLQVDHSYQRLPNQSRIQRITRMFDANRIGRLHVSRRDDGTYFVVDGQHRLLAMRDRGLKYAPCIVFTGLTKEQEARMFVLLNTETQKPSAFQIHRGKLQAGDTDAIAIETIAARYGIEIKEKSGSQMRNRIACIGTLYQILRARFGGAEMVDRIVHLLHDAYPDENNAYLDDIVHGLYIFLRRAMSDPNFDMDRVKHVLHNNALSTIINKGRGLAEFNGNRTRQGIATLLHQLYNKGLRTRKLTDMALSQNAGGDEQE